MTLQDESEAPLDPAQERLRRKLVRLLLVSGAIMFFGFIAVFASIVYKLSERDDADPLAAQSEAGGAIEARIPVPPGARLLSAELDGDRALLRVEALDGRVSLILVDLASGNILGRYAVEPE